MPSSFYCSDYYSIIKTITGKYLLPFIILPLLLTFSLLCAAYYQRIFMIQKLFSIYTHPEENNKLHVEVGSNHIACWCTGDAATFTALEYFTFTYDNTEAGFIDTFREIKRRSILLSNTFPSEEIVWENANFICIPTDKFNDSTMSAYLSIINSPSFQSAPMYNRLNDFVITYTADSIFYKTIKEEMPRASHVHKFYQILNIKNKADKNRLQLHFYQAHFLLVAVKNNTLQLATVFRYQTPQEALYYILNTIDKLEMPAEETIVSVSGFMDENSSLYKELYSYVNNLQLSETGKIKGEHPAHYFTSFNTPAA